ncbi:hypothetical protein LOOC260_113500 [Paucilactobacillus hokkaidonensis JCM 18461]|uniref:DNA-directed RNA polymerase subunit epsilon n=2 Tax=Paucilactobacillus hokkaidonensis TaxID=1193095 RepID=A0A0A1GZJ0_9LACO|nr:DNA-directed RNA polymerase subunit epsilon [Paucilactobacillus hokkaidonensis]KRO09905.1 hypothetical protein IV59_GL000212 [Paucilactobacillus hokkaidonensis]BAP85886.1 hypothetical protein LOOC260_113500 [Paucilactobacillus hokkaidonensis JCM 18461]
MVFKIFYQETKIRNPKRETTHSMYLDSDSESEARVLVETNTTHNIEFIEALSPAALEYEQQDPAFKLTKF